MLADMQRARMLSWELPRLGWRVEVLSPASSEVRQDVIEPDAQDFFPADVPLHEVGSLARRAFELAGSRSPAWRTLLPIYRRGCRLLGSGRFDLVYISTTLFPYFVLGPLWSRRSGVPYVLDFHDPWVRAIPARGWRARLQARLERAAVAHAAGLVSVSPRYLAELESRYARLSPPWRAARRHAVIPFGALERDFAQASGESARTGGASTINIAYVGAGGAIMARSFALVCRALGALRAGGNELAGRARLRLHGTAYGWRPGDARLLEQLAAKEGVGDLVEESPERVPYRRSLELLLRADAALVLGVDDAGYMPSKLFSYALSGKPLLACLRRDSPGFEAVAAGGWGHLLWFERKHEIAPADACAALARFLEEAAARRSFDRRAALEPYLAAAMARRHAELFDACRLPRQE